MSCKSINSCVFNVGVVVDPQITITLIISDDEDYIGWSGDHFLFDNSTKKEGLKREYVFHFYNISILYYFWYRLKMTANISGQIRSFFNNLFQWLWSSHPFTAAAVKASPAPTVLLMLMALLGEEKQK